MDEYYIHTQTVTVITANKKETQLFTGNISKK